MSIIDRAKAHFAAYAARRIEVPEWGEPGNPLVLLAEPLTLAEMSKLRTANKADEHGYLVDLLIMKAKREDGSNAFTLADKWDLRHKVDPVVIARIAADIATAATPAEAEKN